MDDGRLTAIVHHDDVAVYVLYAGGVPAGYSELDGRRKPEVELAYFGLVPEFIGRGLGAPFLRWTVDEAWARHRPRRLWLHTCSLDTPGPWPSTSGAGSCPTARNGCASPNRGCGPVRLTGRDRRAGPLNGPGSG